MLALRIPKAIHLLPVGTWGNFSDARDGVGKSGMLEYTGGNISETCKDGEKVSLLFGTIGTHQRNPTFFRMVPSSTPHGLPFRKIGGSQPPPITSVLIISEAGKAMDFTFGRYIHRVHPNKSPLKILKKDRTWAYAGTAPIFLDTPYYLSNGRVKIDFKFGR